MKKKTFTRLTAAQKRVAIAKDVLEQIKLRTTKIKSGHYWNVGGDDFFGIVSKKTLCTETKCTCCAAGAAVLSGIRLFNRDEVSPYNGATIYELPTTWFESKQLALIEAAFEPFGGAHMMRAHAGDGYVVAVRFNRGIDGLTERARRIFKNIIKNNGEFKP